MKNMSLSKLIVSVFFQGISILIALMLFLTSKLANFETSTEHVIYMFTIFTLLTTNIPKIQNYINERYFPDKKVEPVVVVNNNIPPTTKVVFNINTINISKMQKIDNFVKKHQGENVVIEVNEKK